MSRLKVDQIEDRSGSGITIDDAIKIDTISEKTSGSGVTVDGVLIKDNVAHSGLVKLASTTASNDAAIIFDNFVDHNTYIHYYIALKDIHPENDNVELQIKFRVGGASGSNGSDTYRSGGYYQYANAASSGFFTNTSYTDYSRLANSVGNADNEAISGTGTFFPSTGTAASSGPSAFNIRYTHENSANELQTVDRSVFAYLTATGLNFYYSSGNIVSGEIVIYGVKK